MNVHTLTVSGAFSQAWDWWQKEKKYVYYLLLPGAVASIVSAVLFNTGGIFSGILGFAAQLLALFFGMSVTASLLFFLSSTKKEEWNDWKKYLRLFPKFFVVNLLFGIMIFLGLLFLIIPGIYLAVRYAFVGYIFLEKPETKIEELFTGSARLTEGNRFTVFLIVLASVLCAGAVMGAVGFALGGASEPLFSLFTELGSYLVVNPLIALVSLAAYNQLKKSRGVIQDEPKEEAQEASRLNASEPIALAPELTV